jgi:hypothetical protein
MTLNALFQLVQGNEALSPILWETVDVPSVFSMLAHFGVTVSVGAEVDRAVFGAPAVLGSGPTCAVPVTVLANGNPALLCTLFATDPQPPFRLSAGIVAIEAAHPTDATRRFSMRLLAAHRGAGGRLALIRRGAAAPRAQASSSQASSSQASSNQASSNQASSNPCRTSFSR